MISFYFYFFDTFDNININKYICPQQTQTTAAKEVRPRILKKKKTKLIPCHSINRWMSSVLPPDEELSMCPSTFISSSSSSLLLGGIHPYWTTGTFLPNAIVKSIIHIPLMVILTPGVRKNVCVQNVELFLYVQISQQFSLSSYDTCACNSSPK